MFQDIKCIIQQHINIECSDTRCYNSYQIVIS